MEITFDDVSLIEASLNEDGTISVEDSQTPGEVIVMGPMVPDGPPRMIEDFGDGPPVLCQPVKFTSCIRRKSC